MIDPTELPVNGRPANPADIVEVVWLPALLALITAASTWLIWYYTHHDQKGTSRAYRGTSASG